MPTTSLTASQVLPSAVSIQIHLFCANNSKGQALLECMCLTPGITALYPVVRRPPAVRSSAGPLGNVVMVQEHSVYLVSQLPERIKVGLCFCRSEAGIVVVEFKQFEVED